MKRWVELFILLDMAKDEYQQGQSISPQGSKILKFGTLGVYADDPSQVWAVLLTFLTLFIWFVYLNNELGDQVFRSIFTVIIFGIGTLIIYRFWVTFYRRIWKRFWPR